jgi:hypothetical protein
MKRRLIAGVLAVVLVGYIVVRLPPRSHSRVAHTLSLMYAPLGRPGLSAGEDSGRLHGSTVCATHGKSDQRSGHKPSKMIRGERKES